jgi:hypothetical protein
MHARSWQIPGASLIVPAFPFLDYLHPENAPPHGRLFRADNRNIVFLSAGDYTCLATAAAIEIYYHSPASHFMP